MRHRSFATNYSTNAHLDNALLPPQGRHYWIFGGDATAVFVHTTPDEGGEWRRFAEAHLAALVAVLEHG